MRGVADVKASPACPPAELLAAFLDERLDAIVRAEVIAHLADCENCRELISETAFAKEGTENRRLLPWRGGSRRWIHSAGGLLAAAAVLLLVVRISPLEWPGASQRRLDALVSAVGPQRLIEGRLTGGFEYGPLTSVTRSTQLSSPSLSPELTIAAAEVELALERRRSPGALVAFGAAQLMSGEVDGAIDRISEATRLAPRDAAAWLSLSSAYLEKARRAGGDVSQLLARATSAAELATELDNMSPEAWFNLALSRERQGGRVEAIAAWKRFLEVERDPAWAEEGRRHLAALEQPTE